MKCAVCEQPIDPARQPSVRFSTLHERASLMRFRFGQAATIAAVGDSFLTVLSAATGRKPRELTYWFHWDCWERFSADLLVSDDG